MLFKGNSSRLELLIGKIQAHKESPSPPRGEKCSPRSKDALGTGSSSRHSEDGGGNSRRGGETPSSCATPTSASFLSEPEVDPEMGISPDGNNPAAPYPCQFCERTFPRLSYLKKHEQNHGDQMPYRCSWCSRLFKHKRSRDRHVKLHTGDRRYRCSHCEAAFSRSDHLKIHMKTHDNQKPYQCTACSRGYNTAAALTSHMQSHKKHPSPNQTTKLDVEYGRRSVSSHSTASPPIQNSPSPSLNLSMNAKNAIKSHPSIYKNATNGAKTPIINSPLKLACMYCTKDSFTSMQQLQMHVHAMHQAILNGASLSVESPSHKSESNHSRYREQSNVSRNSNSDNGRTCQREEREKSVEREKGSGAEKGFSCGQCTMKFPGLSELRDHMVTIHRGENFGSSLMMCPLCGIPCASAASYAEHYVLQHCENRRFAPKESIHRDWESGKINGSHENSRPGSEDQPVTSRPDLGTSEPADLTKKHSRASDSGYSTGTLLCGQCGAALKDFESFREHLARHLQADQQSSEVLPRNPCPKCGASFPEREDMLVHLTKHYLGQVTKEYTCGACKKCYPHPDLLQRHLLDTHAHHLYRCAVCRDTFDSRVAIQVHFAVKHSQECQVYRCNSCSNENSPGNSPPGEGRNYFRTEAEMANHVRSIHAPASVLNESPLRRSPVPTAIANPTTPRCVFCGVCCNTDLELQLHLASHSANLYRCPICREGFPVEFLLERHIAQTHRGGIGERNDGRENGRTFRASRSQDDAARAQKRGRSPASSNNNSLNQCDNNNKRANYGSANGGSMTASVQQCELCERAEFATEAELQAHKKLVHTPIKLQSKSLPLLSMTCAYCGEVCRSRSDLESHTRIQHASNEPGGRHKCNICDEVCPSGGILAEHKLQTHCKIQLSDTCVVCRGTLANEAQFIEHVQRHSLEGGESQQRLDSTMPLLPAACVVCRQTLISDLECRLHASHHLRNANGSQITNSSPSPNQHKTQQQQLFQPSSLSCCLCLREFSADDFVSLPSNPVGAGGPPLRVCKPCYVRHSQGLPILNSPYEHVRKSNSERNNWINGKDQTSMEASRERWDVDRSFAGGDTQQSSKTRIADSDDFRCDECGIKFETCNEADLHRVKEHGKVAGNSNTFTCIQCQMSFLTEEKIRQHVRQVHLGSPGRASIDALRCHLCVFEASSPLQLQGHLIEHTFAGCAGLTCYICQSLFTTPHALQNHMLQQHGLGARPYDCNNCSLKFFFRIELDHHAMMAHRRNEVSSPTVDVGQEITTENQTSMEAEKQNKEETIEENPEDKTCPKVITVKEEIVHSSDEKEFHADDDVEEDGDDDAKGEKAHLVATKIETFASSHGENKMQS
ncbi:zinc finger protein 423 homolog isoform X1 [Venturia canescens]|uniref:zinc finger protein 423 homolog isoform X1 n=1 Tax=Venturia canescens TaxID=32260 RepID=UPI001C9CDA47|nr:zinc finger protein 423 homolog isoform X1 [Venturia canescens]